MASARPPSGGTPTARLELDLSSFRNAPNVAREAGRALAREIEAALKQTQAAQAAAEKQRTAELQAALRQRVVAVKAAKREEVEAQRAAEREQAAAEKQRVAETKATLRQRAIAVKAAAREETEAQRTAEREQAAAEKQRTAELQAALRQRVVAVKAAKREEVEAARVAAREETQIQRAATQQQQAIRQGMTSFVGAALGGPIGGIAGAVAGGGAAGIGLAAGLAVSQGARFAVDAAQTAAAYDRQELAARNLAGSQGKLNTLMSAYDRATGGAVDKASALSNVTRLMAVGFADNAAELTRFTTGVRGAAIAMGKAQDEISQEVQLAISNQSLKRLDQIGLGVTEVNTRIAELRASNQGMTREAAFQEAVLGLLNEKYGALADSIEGQATGTERLTKSWADMRLELGQDIQVNTNQATGALADLLNWITKVRLERRQLIEDVQQEGAAQARQILIERGQLVGLPPLTPSAANRSGNTPFRPTASRGFTDEQESVMVNRQNAIDQLNRGTRQGIDDVMSEGAAQRRQVIANYEKQATREAEDFARQRLNAERKFALSLLDVAQDSARQRVAWEEELARNIAQAQADSAERVAELRDDSSKQLVKSEEKYAEDREKRQREHQKTLREAAANLDAVAVREEQRRFRDEAKEAKDAHEEQKRDIGAQLNERLDDEAKSLAKSERQAREANARRVEEQAANDKLRIEEMKAAFAEQKLQEDEERGIRLGRQAEDHAAQLAEMATQQGERIQQIKDQAQAEREQIDKDYDVALAAVGIQTARYLKEHERVINEAINGHMRYVNAINDAWKQSYPGHPSAADPYANDPAYQNQNQNSPSAIPPAATLPFTPLAPWTPSKQTTIQGGMHVTINTPSTFAPNEESENWLLGVFNRLFEEHEP